MKRLRVLPLAAAPLVLGCASSASSAETPNPHAHHRTAGHDFKDAEAWSAEFDDPARDAWQKPDEVVALMGIPGGAIVADVGAGTGYFEARLARAAGAGGKVIALDVEPDMVAFMTKRFDREATPNVEARACGLDTTGLEPGSVDRILIVDTWHHIGAREAYAKHLASVLRPGGTVTIVDFTMDSPKGPPPGHRVDEKTAIAELTAGGFEASVVEESLPDQYVVVGRR